MTRTGPALAAWLLFVPGCFQPDVASDYLPAGGADEPPADLFRDTGTTLPDPCAGAPPPTGGALHFRVRTSSAGGKFAPRNVGAIWIQDGAGAFVKTLERWGTTRAKWLVTFNEASGGDVVDAITGATKIAHETHEVTWTLDDAAGCPAAPGDHAIWIEMTDKSGPGVTLNVPFVLATPGQDLFPEDAPTFHDMALQWE